MRVVDRTGTGAIYFGSGNSDFSNPESFKNGSAVQSFTLRHQVVIDTSTGYFLRKRATLTVLHSTA
jgi:hypothetical protein